MSLSAPIGRRGATLVALAGALLAATPAHRARAQTVAFTHVAVVDGTGAAPRRDATVIVRDGRIAAVGSAAAVAVPAGARVVDASGQWLIPGLWDMHVHLRDATAAALPVLAAMGVTTVRDLSTDLGTIAGWRREMASGARVGPRILAAGGTIDGPKHPSEDRIAVATAADARRVVDSLQAAGADFIKLYEFLPRDAYFAAIAEARARGLRPVGRVPRDVRLQESADAGLRTFERMSGVPLPCPFSVRLLSRTPGLSDVVPPCGSERDRAAVYAQLRARDAAVTPTLVSFRGLARADDRSANDDPELRYAAPALRAVWQRKLAKWPHAVPTSYRRDMIKLFLPTVGAADRAGVRIVAGSDLGSPYVVPGFAVHDELQLLVEAGLSPMEALQAATRNAAAAAGEAGHAGTIEPGKAADLVLLAADPLADIRNTERIQAVVLHGRLLDRAALDRLLGR